MVAAVLGLLYRQEVQALALRMGLKVDAGLSVFYSIGTRLMCLYQ